MLPSQFIHVLSRARNSQARQQIRAFMQQKSSPLELGCPSQAKPRERYLLPWQPARPLAIASTSAAAAAAAAGGSNSKLKHLLRSTKYSQITGEDVSYFVKELGAGCVVTDEHALEAYNTDWMHKYHGHSKLALRPRTVEDVSKILAYCNQRRLAVVPQGGNTGLVGGSVPVFDEIVISLTAMNKILAFDEVSGIITCQAGCVLEVIDNFLHEHNHTMPLDLGAKGSCQIGGNVATNAGGLRLLRYGSLHGTVLGVQAVLADGTIIDNLSTLRKDNTGFHLNHLFIGSEGALGIITAVSIVTPKKPKSTMVAVLACENFDKVQKAFVEAKSDLGEIISAIEYFDRPSMELVLKHQEGTRDPLSAPQPLYLLIETSGSNHDHDQAKLVSFLEAAMEKGLITDGALAQDHTQVKEFWRLREGISESLSREGAVYKYDLSLPVAAMYDLVEEMRTRLAGKAAVVSFGHLGDGNLHLNIHTPKFEQEVLDLIEPFVYEWTGSRRGSISAEHGIGVMKPSHLHYSKRPEAVAMMHSIKHLLDPNAILNPYKVLPSTN